MANHSQIIKRDKSGITMNQVKKILDDMNTTYFGGLLNYEEYEDSLVIFENPAGRDAVQMWFEEDFENYITDVDVEVIEGTYLDIRHGHTTQFVWWLESRIMHTIANELGAEIIGEGYHGQQEKCIG
jgi:hypothetical protein